MSFFKRWKKINWGDIFVKNWQAKLASIFVAVVLWWFVYTQTNTERAFSIPIQYINLPKNRTILRTNDTTVRIYVQGRKDRVVAFEVQHVRVFSDLANAGTGWSTNELQLALRNIDPTIAVTLERTSSVVFIDLLQVMTVPIMAQTVDAVMEGFEVEGIEVTPVSVIVQGPASILTNIQHIQTVPVSLKGLESTLTTNVSLVLPDTVTTLGQEDAAITIRIRPYPSPISSDTNSFIEEQL